MSQWLKQIVDQQKSVESGSRVKAEESALVIKCGEYNCLVGFEYLSEVIEYQNIIPYPREHGLHLGVLNMRGEIVPVLSLLALFGEPEKTKLCFHKGKRIIIFRRPSGVFALAAEQVKKISLEAGSLSSASDIEVDGLVYRVLSESFFEELESKVGESAA